MRSIRKRNWFLRRFVLGFAVAALAAPAAAQARIDEGVSPSAAGAIKAHQFQVHNAVSPSVAGAIKAHQFQVDKGESPRSSSSTKLVSANGFDWDDALVGGVIALGAVFLGGAAFRVTRHRGEAQTV
jgi:hypothetical protein